jgi:hypothetical protein
MCGYRFVVLEAMLSSLGLQVEQTTCEPFRVIVSTIAYHKLDEASVTIVTRP